MKAPIIVLTTKALPDFKLEIKFEDGITKIVDLKKLPFQGRWKELQTKKELFETVFVEDGYPTWKFPDGEFSFNPDDLYKNGEIKDNLKVSASFSEKIKNKVKKK